MNESILIIEDNDNIRESTAEILEFSGYQVLQARNGKIGVEMASSQKPDLILCDIMMPELDGYGVLYLLNKNPVTNAIPFIFLTAKVERADFRRGMEMGADDYLTKPFDDIELLNAVETRLKKEEKQKAYHSNTLQSLEKLTAIPQTGATELKALIESRKIRQIKKKQILYYAGDQPPGLYLVLEGCIKTAKQADDGRDLITGLYYPDDYLGVSALLLDEAFSETAQAVEDTAVCLLLKDSVLKLLNKYPQIGNQFIKILSNNIRDKEEQLLDLAYNSVRKRLSHTLLRLSRQSPDGLNEFKISRDQLATMVGIAIETVSRTLSDFQNEGLIDKKGSLLRILDQEGLVGMKN
ncbi:Regulator of RpoS [Dyadobacter sp. CECT 9623]|uniref:Regulator of RpoS n=1 Tax=Dyadobacter linearis TaxID=2823330 RepID=A0ABM8UJ62_9BACT|nr:response regulator [Dyadobacter sp. CECT 9623]CAG5067521.1 Regulator of RpoS [Dyadobacter sp. CECT 9623]